MSGSYYVIDLLNRFKIKVIINNFRFWFQFLAKVEMFRNVIILPVGVSNIAIECDFDCWKFLQTFLYAIISRGSQAKHRNKLGYVRIWIIRA